MGPDNLFPRVFGHRYPLITRAEGIRLWDADGRELLDSTSGAISVTSIGHGRAEVAEAIAAQARRLDYVHDNEFHNEPSLKLASAVTRFAGPPYERAVFFSGGSEAVEAAIKLARSYHLLTGSPDRNVVIGRKRSFHGVTLFALGVGDVPDRKSPYEDYLPRATAKIPAPYCYRCPLGLRFPECSVACAEELERLILEIGPEHISAFIAEPIVGAAAPALTPPAGYFEAVRRICDRYGVIWIADEIVTGFGRTGKNFGFEHWDAKPDILVVGKGLSGGYVPLSGLLIADRVTRPFEERSAAFVHGLTNQNHPVACAAGLAVLGVIQAEELVDNAAAQGAYLGARLAALAQEVPAVGEVRGRGLLWALELVADRETRVPFDPSIGMGRRVSQQGLEHGLVIRASGSGSASGDEVFISPPLIVTRDDIGEIVDRFQATLDDVLARLPATGHGDR